MLFRSTQLLVELRYFEYSIFLKIQTICTYNVHKFLFNLRNSGYLNFLQIRQSVHNFPLHVHNFVHSTYPQNSDFLQNPENSYI